MSSIKLTADSGGGTFEIKAPSSGSNARVLTVPDTASGSVLTTTNPKSGNILQVVQTVKTDVVSRGGSSGQDALAAISGFSVNITPSATSSKILVLVNIKQGETNNAWAKYQLYRDSTPIYLGDTASGKTPCSNFSYESQFSLANVSEYFLDSPNTTSQITYQVYWGARGGSGTIAYLNRTGNDSGDHAPITASSITAMGIAA